MSNFFTTNCAFDLIFFFRYYSVTAINLMYSRCCTCSTIAHSTSLMLYNTSSFTFYTSTFLIILVTSIVILSCPITSKFCADLEAWVFCFKHFETFVFPKTIKSRLSPCFKKCTVFFHAIPKSQLCELERSPQICNPTPPNNRCQYLFVLFKTMCKPS